VVNYAAPLLIEAPQRPLRPEDFTASDLELIRVINAEERLIDFVRFMWPAVEPARKFVDGWCIGAICEHLTAVTDGEIVRLIINVPPGMMKSLTTDVFWPAWEWLTKPANRYVSVSYTSSLTERDNGKTVNLIRSPRFQKHWGERFAMTQVGVGKIANDRTGWKLATSVDGVGTGERGDRVILDDLISVKQADSSVVRETAQRYVRETLPTRMNDPRSSAIVAIEQRTHEDDATGTLLSDGGDYVHLMIPMEWDGRRYHTSIGWTDPRTVEDIDPGNAAREPHEVRGELAFPERFPAWVVERDKKAMGSYAVASQFQQSPSPRGGGIIKREWWQQWGPDDPKGVKFPPFDLVVGIVDGAYTTQNQNDPTAMAVLGTFLDPYSGMPKVMLAQCWAERMELHAGVQKIDATARKYRVSMLLVENKATGHSVVQELHRLFADKPYSVVLLDPRGSVAGRGGYDKVARAMSVVPVFEDEMVYAPRTDWAEAAITECAVFPRGSHDDRVDAIVGGIRWLRDQGALLRVVEAVEAERENAMQEDERGRQPVLYRA
jgi:predicted phage terminase large subunit-like protein